MSPWDAALERGSERVVVCFAGRDPSDPRRAAATPAEALARRVRAASLSSSSAPETAWAKQVHSARILDASSPGSCGEGDALVTERRGLALTVVTADCVPVILAVREAGGPVAAVHAGWRGIASGIVPAAVQRMTSMGRLTQGLVAWIGPAIGPCCYEVGAEVAERVAAACGAGSLETLTRPNPDPHRAHPHLDLVQAVELQLGQAGVGTVRRLGACTHCHPESLWSYRRDGTAAGRNYAFVWISDASDPDPEPAAALRASTPRGSRAKARS